MPFSTSISSSHVAIFHDALYQSDAICYNLQHTFKSSAVMLSVLTSQFHGWMHLIFSWIMFQISFYINVDPSEGYLNVFSSSF
jgi:hypothetical protein